MNKLRKAPTKLSTACALPVVSVTDPIRPLLMSASGAKDSSRSSASHLLTTNQTLLVTGSDEAHHPVSPRTIGLFDALQPSQVTFGAPLPQELKNNRLRPARWRLTAHFCRSQQALCKQSRGHEEAKSQAWRNSLTIVLLISAPEVFINVFNGLTFEKVSKRITRPCVSSCKYVGTSVSASRPLAACFS